jgi:hypothetical protein
MPAHLYEDCTFLNTTATGKKFQKKTRISSQANYLDPTLNEKIATAAKTINFARFRPDFADIDHSRAKICLRPYTSRLPTKRAKSHHGRTR